MNEAQQHSSGAGKLIFGTRRDAYDYIIAGGGCAGLSFAMHLVHSGRFRDKRILIIDRDAKQTNDRTWCFWEKEEGLFESIVYKRWNTLDFHAPDFSKELAITPYRYKLIRGLDFYNHCISHLKAHANITWVQGAVEEVFSNEESTGIVIDGEKVCASYVFNSILFDRPQLKKSDYWLLQHFKGWLIQPNQPVFNPDKALLMDFRTGQEHGTTFFYVLPFSDREALIEYTVFSKDRLEDEEYNEALKAYIKDKWNVQDYSIREREFGIIPMTNYSFPARKGNIINLGTAGGQTKGSSGYTFRFVQKHTAALVKSLAEQGHPFHSKQQGKRFHFYDSVLLNILQRRKLEGSDIFTTLFQRNTPGQIFKFLDNETDLLEDLNILRTLPALPFTGAALDHLLS